MPAIRYRLNSCAAMAEAFPSDNPVEIRTYNGEWERLKWLGFVCESGSKMIEFSRRGKMRAHEVTNGPGLGSREWRTLSGGEYVVVIIIPLKSGYGVYGLVDKYGWPVIKGDDKPVLKLVG